MDPGLPAPPPPPRTVRYAFTAPGEPLGPGETEIDDLRLVEFMREEMVRRAAELRAKLAELEAGLPSPERTRLVAREVPVAGGDRD